jgi:hypothetical protein
MTYRDELLTLIQNGTRPADIYAYFQSNCHLLRPRILSLLEDIGMSILVLLSKDEISDERRRGLQELSTTY